MFLLQIASNRGGTLLPMFLTSHTSAAPLAFANRVRPGCPTCSEGELPSGVVFLRGGLGTPPPDAEVKGKFLHPWPEALHAFNAHGEVAMKVCMPGLCRR